MFSSFSSGIFLGFLLLNVDGDDMKIKKGEEDEENLTFLN